MVVPAIEIEDVSFFYEGKTSPALSNLSASFHPHDFVGIVGAVGSGKTTLLYCCNGLIPKEIRGQFRGRVKIFGNDIAKLSFKNIASFCATVFQDPDDQIFNLSVLDEVSFGLICQGMPKEEAEKKAIAAIRKLGLSDCIYDDPTELSVGQKQKVVLASALAQDAKILLLDEPVSSLDWKSASEFYSILSALSKEGRTIVITEQDTCLLWKYANRVIVMDKGKMIAQGKPSILFDKKIEKLGLRLPER
ncbi:MAG: energy-coupling factor ABC transporter ATP-binding protein [Candidatus Micrarchaeota archaeon]|nr:energy-coupling factor ABC transporter ATP-binding protein [Candidatus Micrarchaeota archaeon]